MSDIWQNRIAEFFNGSPTEKDRLRLNEWIKSDHRNVRRFVREAMVHSHLHDLMRAQEAMNDGRSVA